MNNINPCSEIELEGPQKLSLQPSEEYRCYTFTLYQLSSIQQGIQAGHAAVELGIKAYKRQMQLREGTWFSMYYKWATDWKTMVLLNGGDIEELCDIRNFFSSADVYQYPTAAFHESLESLSGLLTSVAIILPARIFKTAEELRKAKPVMSFDYPDSFTDWELELIDRLSKASLAR
jgi:hypothetical protein